MHHRIASTMFDLPQPLGPTTPTFCSSNVSTVRSQKDLKPMISIRLIRMDARTLPDRGDRGGRRPTSVYDVQVRGVMVLALLLGAGSVRAAPVVKVRGRP